jgi:hypothetical protein
MTKEKPSTEKLVARYFEIGVLIEGAEGVEKLKLQSEQFNLLFWLQAEIGIRG